MSPAGRRDIDLVQELWEAMKVGGVEAVIRLTDPEVVWEPFAAGGRALCGHDELRRYFDDMQRRGVVMEAEAYVFEAVGGSCVLVPGSVRVSVAGGFEDHQLHWLYRLHDGRLAHAQSFTSREAALAAAAVP
jgi:ketosteroid isomerase-like protein